jgi:hypothetical protein
MFQRVQWEQNNQVGSAKGFCSWWCQIEATNTPGGYSCLWRTPKLQKSQSSIKKAAALMIILAVCLKTEVTWQWNMEKKPWIPPLLFAITLQISTNIVSSFMMSATSDQQISSEGCDNLWNTAINVAIVLDSTWVTQFCRRRTCKSNCNVFKRCQSSQTKSMLLVLLRRDTQRETQRDSETEKDTERADDHLHHWGRQRWVEPSGYSGLSEEAYMVILPQL